MHKNNLNIRKLA